MSHGPESTDWVIVFCLLGAATTVLVTSALFFWG